MSNFQELTVEKLGTSQGVLILNNMLRFLFSKVTESGDNIDVSFGFGTPESSVTKGIGALFLRMDGGANTTIYVKESGSASTGWVAK